MNAFYNNIKSLVVTVCLILASSSCYPQFGIRIGGGASDLIFLNDGQVPYLGYETNAVVHNLPLLSFQAGAIRQMEVSKRLDFNIGLLFSQQGLDYSTSYIYDDIKYRLNISYLKLPVLAKFKTSIKDNRHSGIIVGPYISGALKSTLVTEIQGTTRREKQENVNFIDLGAIAGYSWDIGRDPGKMFVDFRMSYSMVNSMKILENSIPRYYGPEKEYVRNVTIILAFEYML